MDVAWALIKSVWLTHQKDPVEDIGIWLLMMFGYVTVPNVPVTRLAHRIPI